MAVATPLNQNVDHIPVLIDRPPQVEALTADTVVPLFCQLKPNEAKPIARQNRAAISLDAGDLVPRGERPATKESIVCCSQQMSAAAKQIVHLAVNAQEPLRLSR